MQTSVSKINNSGKNISQNTSCCMHGTKKERWVKHLKRVIERI